MASSSRISGADVQITGVLDMRGNRITGLETDVNVYPLSSDEGATKAYVDSQKAAIEAALPTLVNNGTF